MSDDGDRPARASSIMMIVGGTAALAGGATHGDLPEASGAAALAFVAEHPAYALVHFVSILGAVLWALGLAGANRSRQSGLRQSLTTAAGHASLIGAAVLAVQFSLDGVGLEALAARWSEPGADTVMFEVIAEVAPEVLIGAALAWIMLLYGVPPILAGASLVLDGRSYLGWVGIVLGSFALVGGLALAVGLSLIPDWLVFAGATVGVNLWIIAFGIHIWRRATRHLGAA